MTLSSTTTRAGYTANGVLTAFAYPFRIDDEDHIEVYLDDVLQASGYSLSGVGNDSGGNVTFSSAPADGTDVTVIRAVPLTQPTDLPTQGPLDTAAIERRFDQIVMLAQQLRELIDRSLVLPPSAGALGLELPALEASRFLAVNAGGDGLLWAAGTTEVPVSSFMETVLDDTTAAAARTTLGGSTVGQALFTAASAAAARDAIARTPGIGHGMVLSYVGANEASLSAGSRRDRTDASNLVLASAMSKLLGTAWAAGTGQGGRLSAAAEASSTAYCVWVIHNPTTGATDWGYDVSATAPTLPTGYTQYFGPISMVFNDGSSNITPFDQSNDFWQPRTQILVVSDNTLAATVLETVAVPAPPHAVCSLHVQRSDSGALGDFRQTTRGGSQSEANNFTSQQYVSSTFTGAVMDFGRTLVNIGSNAQVTYGVQTETTVAAVTIYLEGFFIPNWRISA